MSRPHGNPSTRLIFVPADDADTVGLDKRYYDYLTGSVPDESISSSLILHCVIEQVICYGEGGSIWIVIFEWG